MATRKATPEWARFFNLRRIANSLGIQQDKLYNNIRGVYDSLHDENKEIARLMIPHVKEFFNKIGYDVTFSKIKK